MSVGNLEEIIDDNHAIVSTSVGSEHYVSILSFVDKDQLEPGCSVLLNHKVPDMQVIVLVCNVFNFHRTVKYMYTYIDVWHRLLGCDIYVCISCYPSGS